MASIGQDNDIKAFEKIMFNLNARINPIMHCIVLAEDEVLRLELNLKNWFSLQSGLNQS